MRPDARVLNGHMLYEVDRCLQYAPFAEAPAYHPSVGTGLDPDRPRHLFSVGRLGQRSPENGGL